MRPGYGHMRSSHLVALCCLATPIVALADPVVVVLPEGSSSVIVEGAERYDDGALPLVVPEPPVEPRTRSFWAPHPDAAAWPHGMNLRAPPCGLRAVAVHGLFEGDVFGVAHVVVLEDGLPDPTPWLAGGLLGLAALLAARRRSHAIGELAA